MPMPACQPTEHPPFIHHTISFHCVHLPNTLSVRCGERRTFQSHTAYVCRTDVRVRAVSNKQRRRYAYTRSLARIRMPWCTHTVALVQPFSYIFIRMGGTFSMAVWLLLDFSFFYSQPTVLSHVSVRWEKKRHPRVSASVRHAYACLCMCVSNVFGSRRGIRHRRSLDKGTNTG